MGENNANKQGQTFIEKKPSKASKFKSALKKLKTPKGIMLILVLVLLTAGVITLIWSFSQDSNYVPVSELGEDQVIDQELIDQQLQQYESDPSSVPSGSFKPELGDDYFIVDEEANNQESAQ